MKGSRALLVLAVASLAVPCLQAAPKWDHTAFSISAITGDVDGIDRVRSLNGQVMFTIPHGAIGFTGSYNRTTLVGGQFVGTAGLGALLQFSDVKKEAASLIGLGITHWTDEAMFVYDWTLSARAGFTFTRGQVFGTMYGSFSRFYGPDAVKKTDLKELFVGIGFRK